MLAFPNAKVNLGLHITGKRKDGYHNIESCLFPIPWTDVLEVIPSRSFSFTSTGLPIEGGDSDNLCVKAYDLLKKSHNLPPLDIHLHKVIPMGAGLGGGSSDGAFTLKIINELCQLELSDKILMEYAGDLGSDCPFFIANQPVIARGRGTELTPFEVDLSGWYIALSCPDVHVSTKEAYAEAIPKSSCNPIQYTLAHQDNWRQGLRNDFELSIFRKYPIIQSIKVKMYDLGASYASMTGSGAAVFGLFKSKPVGNFNFLEQLK